MKRICVLLLLLFIPAALAENSYDDLGFYGEYNMWPVQRGGLWGFVDDTGALIIPCEWEETGDVLNGRAAVMKGGKWGIICQNGELAVPCQWDKIRMETDGGYTMWRGKYAGAMAGDGTMLIPCDTYSWVGPAIDGVRHVRTDQRWGMCTADGTPITPCKWLDESYFSQGMAFVQSEEGYGYIDLQGKVVIPCQYTLADDFHLGSAVVRLAGFGGFQLIDRTGAVLSGPWESMEQYGQNELLLVSQNGKYGYIDRRGQVAIPLQYDNAQVFGDGLALVKLGEDAFWINASGEKVLDRPKGYFSAPFRDGLAGMRDASERGGLMDKTGAWIIPCEWETWFDYSFGENDITAAKKDNQVGFLNRSGELIAGRTYPAARVRYGVDRHILFLLEEGVLSVWSAQGIQIN